MYTRYCPIIMCIGTSAEVPTDTNNCGEYTEVY